MGVKDNLEAAARFNENKPILERLYAEMIARRKDAGLTTSLAHEELSKILGIRSEVATFNGETIKNLEDLDYLERLLLRSNMHYGLLKAADKGGKLVQPEDYITRTENTYFANRERYDSYTHLSHLQTHGRRMSIYLNYLGFRTNRQKFFGVFESLHKDLAYFANNTKTSEKIKAWLKSRKVN